MSPADSLALLCINGTLQVKIHSHLSFTNFENINDNNYVMGQETG